MYRLARRGARGVVRRRAGDDRDLGARALAHVGTDRALGHGRGAGGGRRRAARRPEHGAADQDRAVGSQHGDLRRPRRVPARGHGADLDPRLLQRDAPRLRDRRDVPGAGDRALRAGAGPSARHPAQGALQSDAGLRREPSAQDLGPGLHALRGDRQRHLAARHPGRPGGPRTR